MGPTRSLLECPTAILYESTNCLRLALQPDNYRKTGLSADTFESQGYANVGLANSTARLFRLASPRHMKKRHVLTVLARPNGKGIWNGPNPQAWLSCSPSFAIRSLPAFMLKRLPRADTLKPQKLATGCEDQNNAGWAVRLGGKGNSRLSRLP